MAVQLVKREANFPFKEEIFTFNTEAEAKAEGVAILKEKGWYEGCFEVLNAWGFCACPYFSLKIKDVEP